MERPASQGDDTDRAARAIAYVLLGIFLGALVPIVMMGMVE